MTWALRRGGYTRQPRIRAGAGRLAEHRRPRLEQHAAASITTPLQGLKAAYGAPFRVQYEEGTDVARAAAAAKFCDVATTVRGFAAATAWMSSSSSGCKVSDTRSPPRPACGDPSAAPSSAILRAAASSPGLGCFGRWSVHGPFSPGSRYSPSSRKVEVLIREARVAQAMAKRVQGPEVLLRVPTVADLRALVVANRVRCASGSNSCAKL
jgi:hypothetical protein